MLEQGRWWMVVVIAGGVLWLAGCAPAAPAPAPAAAVPSSPPQTLSPSVTAAVQRSAVPAATATPLPPSPTASPSPTFEICSPLDGIPLAALPEMIVNPFAPPPPGSDDPHQGVDFADVDPVYQIALEGRVVRAAMAGTVAGVMRDRFPYGNAVLVETPLSRLPASWLEILQIPPVIPLREGQSALTCPESAGESVDLAGSRSVYLLYAHLKSLAAPDLGEAVTCGMPLGEIGQTGNALNPHLHLEMRVGPADVRLERMAHYTSDASLDEMANYCLWRVSGAFQVLDPSLLLVPDG